MDSAQANIFSVIFRWSAVIFLLLTSPVLLLSWALPIVKSSVVLQWYSRLLLRCMGMRITLINGEARKIDSAETQDRGTLLVAGHISWIDVLAISAVTPGALSFVARGDLVDWPILGALARSMKVISINRERLRELPTVIEIMTQRLHQGNTVVVFPEGTTWCGIAYGAFRPALFQAAIDAQAMVQPVSIRYLEAGELTAAPCFVGDETILESLRRLIGLRGSTVELTFAAVQEPGADRRELAFRCDKEARGPQISATAIDLAAYLALEHQGVR
ncbi:MAG: lysophospholipid acyltransferase family protein [Mycobacteriaceae bacterium]